MIAGVLKQLLLPPCSLFALVALGLVLARRRRRLGLWIAGTAAIVLVLLTVPLLSAGLLISLQADPALPAQGPLPEAQAIVVLGADLNPWAPELGTATVGALSLERVRYGARLARRTGLPVLATGGAGKAGAPSVAELMGAVLEDELGVPLRWTESRASNTRENAELSAALLGDEDIERVLLVTHAWHMRRAKRAFEAAGLEVVPAPTAFRLWPPTRPGTLLPSARSLRESRWAIHEWLGLLWYALTE